MKKKRIIKIVLIVMVITMGCTVTAFAAGDVFSASESFLGDAQKFIIKVSSVAAVIGIGLGALILKFAHGNAQKIEKGWLAIKSSIFGFALVNGAPLIFATIVKYFN